MGKRNRTVPCDVRGSLAQAADHERHGRPPGGEQGRGALAPEGTRNSYPSPSLCIPWEVTCLLGRRSSAGFSGGGGLGKGDGILGSPGCSPASATPSWWGCWSPCAPRWTATRSGRPTRSNTYTIPIVYDLRQTCSMCSLHAYVRPLNPLFLTRRVPYQFVAMLMVLGYVDAPPRKGLSPCVAACVKAPWRLQQCCSRCSS